MNPKRLVAISLSWVCFGLTAGAGCNLIAGLDNVRFEGSTSGTTAQGGSSGSTGGAGGTSSNGGSTSAQGGTSTSAETATSTSSQGGSTSSQSGSDSSSSMQSGSSSSDASSTSTGGLTGPITCGKATCQLPDEGCCWDKFGTGGAAPESGQCLKNPVQAADCNTKVEQDGVHTIISCQTKDECPTGQLCCGDVVMFDAGGGQQVSYYPAVNCRLDCPYPVRIMCTGPGDPVCPAPLTCKQSQLLPNGFFVCSMN